MWWRRSFKESVDTNTDSPRESSKNAKRLASPRSFGGVYILESIRVSVFAFFFFRFAPLIDRSFSFKGVCLGCFPFFQFLQSASFSIGSFSPYPVSLPENTGKTRPRITASLGFLFEAPEP